MPDRRLLTGLWAALAAMPAAALETVVLEPVADNTLYETPIDQQGQQYEVSNGKGIFLFVGRAGLDAGFRLRRGLIKFDIQAAVPDGATIEWAELNMFQSKAAPGSPPADIGLYPALLGWGEGDSNATGPEGQGAFALNGDATWHHRFWPDQLWLTAGGNYSGTASATTTVGATLGSYTWPCTQALLDDLSAWRQAPETNLGWVVVGGEAAGHSAHRFGTREHDDPAERPTLTIRYRLSDVTLEDGFETPVSCP